MSGRGKNRVAEESSSDDDKRGGDAQSEPEVSSDEEPRAKEKKAQGKGDIALMGTAVGEAISDLTTSMVKLQEMFQSVVDEQERMKKKLDRVGKKPRGVGVQDGGASSSGSEDGLGAIGDSADSVLDALSKLGDKPAKNGGFRKRGKKWDFSSSESSDSENDAGGARRGDGWDPDKRIAHETLRKIKATRARSVTEWVYMEEKTFVKDPRAFHEARRAAQIIDLALSGRVKDVIECSVRTMLSMHTKCKYNAPEVIEVMAWEPPREVVSRSWVAGLSRQIEKERKLKKEVKQKDKKSDGAAPAWKKKPDGAKP